MKQNLYSVYDKQSETFGKPFISINDILAKRLYEEAQNDPQSQLNKYPQDFKLKKLGTFNIKSGELIQDLQDVL